MLPFLLFNLFLFGFVLIFLQDEFIAGIFFIGLFPVSDELTNIVPFFFERVEIVAYWIREGVLFLQTWSSSMILSTSFGSLNLRSKLLRMILGSCPFSALNQLMSKPGILINIHTFLLQFNISLIRALFALKESQAVPYPKISHMLEPI